MQNISDINLQEELESGGAVFILYGGAGCSVCQNLRPRLASMLEQQFPEMRYVYVDCERFPDICAQHGVFSLPVVQAYIDGMKVAEEVRLFSIKQLVQTIEKPYTMWRKQLQDQEI